MRGRPLVTLGYAMAIFALMACPREEEDARVLSGLNFGDGGAYAVYVRHPEHGDFLVRDREALLANRDRLRVARTWRSLLPGEGNRDYGVTVFRDGEVILTVAGAALDPFDVGTLPQNGLRVTRHSVSHTAEEARALRTRLDAAADAYVLSGPPTDPRDDARLGDYEFTIRFPTTVSPTRASSGARDDRRTTIDEGDIDAIDRRLRACLADGIAAAGTPRTHALNVTHGTTTGALLYAPPALGGGRLRAAASGAPLTLDGLALVDFRATIRTDSAAAARLRDLDFGACLNEAQDRDALLRGELRRLLTLAKRGGSRDSPLPIVSGYRDRVEVGPMRRRLWGVTWIEVA